VLTFIVRTKFLHLVLKIK